MLLGAMFLLVYAFPLAGTSEAFGWICEYTCNRGLGFVVATALSGLNGVVDLSCLACAL